MVRIRFWFGNTSENVTERIRDKDVIPETITYQKKTFSCLPKPTLTVNQEPLFFFFYANPITLQTSKKVYKKLQDDRKKVLEKIDIHANEMSQILDDLQPDIPVILPELDKKHVDYANTRIYNCLARYEALDNYLIAYEIAYEKLMVIEKNFSTSLHDLRIDESLYTQPTITYDKDGKAVEEVYYETPENFDALGNSKFLEDLIKAGITKQSVIMMTFSFFFGVFVVATILLGAKIVGVW